MEGFWGVCLKVLRVWAMDLVMGFGDARICDIIGGGKVAEWLKALVLKTREGNLRRFESCPFRQIRLAN